MPTLHNDPNLHVPVTCTRTYVDVDSHVQFILEGCDQSDVWSYAELLSMLPRFIKLIKAVAATDPRDISAALLNRSKASAVVDDLASANIHTL